MHSLYVLMCVNLHESQSKCPRKGVGAPMSMKFNSGSMCFMGSQLNLCPRRGLDLVGLYPKLDSKPGGIQQSFVWLVSVEGARSLPALNVSFTGMG